MTQERRSIELPVRAGVCAFDMDECTVTLAFDTEQEVRDFASALHSRKRVRLMDDTPKSHVSDWRPFDSAPKDGSYIIAVVGQISDHEWWRHLSGRCFVIKHMWIASDGMDMGWAVFPGMSAGGDRFTHWMPLPEAPK